MAVPLYLFLSGAGTGKSRNAAKLHKTACRCFDRTYVGKKNKRSVDLLEDPFVFHISFENGSGIQTEELDPWRAIGSRNASSTATSNKLKPEKISIDYITRVVPSDTH
jgi:hypothetical protein